MAGLFGCGNDGQLRSNVWMLCDGGGISQDNVTEDEMMQPLLHKFPSGCKIIVEVVFEYFRIGWQYQGVTYSPGIGSYYDFSEALQKAYDELEVQFPDLRTR